MSMVSPPLLAADAMETPIVKMPALFTKSREPIALAEADLKALQARHGRLEQRLAGIVADYDRVAGEQRRHLVEHDDPDEGAVSSLVVELRGISDQRSVAEKAMAEVALLIEDGQKRLTVLRDQADRHRVAAECEARAARIETEALRLVEVATMLADARRDFEAAIGTDAIGEIEHHPVWMGRETVRAALMMAAPGAMRPFYHGGAGKVAVAEEGPPPDPMAVARARLTDPLRAHAEAVRAGRVAPSAPMAPVIPPTPVPLAIPEKTVIFRELTSYVDETGRGCPLDVGTAHIPAPVADAAIRQGLAYLPGTPEATEVLRQIREDAGRAHIAGSMRPKRENPIRTGGIHTRIDIDLTTWRAAERARIAAEAHGEAA